MINFADAIGYLAASLTTTAFLPQVLKIWRSHSTKDLSLPMVIILVSGIALWLLYGLLVGDRPVIFANLITLILNLIILGFKLRYG